MSKNRKPATPKPDIGNLYLVLLRHTMDDLPIFLTPNQGEAESVAASTLPDDRNAQRAEEVLGIDCSTPLNTTVVRFKADGTPCGMKVIHEFTDEQLQDYEKRFKKRWARAKAKAAKK